MKELIEKINKFIKSSLPKDVSDELQKSMDAHASAEYAYLGKILGAVMGLVIVLLGGYFLMSKIGQPEKNRTNSIGIEFVLIPSGSFQMGCSDGDNDCLDDEIPQHKVTISNSFYMGKYEVTQGQWKRVMGNNLSYFQNCGENCPVRTG
jgi:formylglycine-generating enzyme required for sulfatase activity